MKKIRTKEEKRLVFLMGVMGYAMFLAGFCIGIGVGVY